MFGASACSIELGLGGGYIYFDLIAHFKCCWNSMLIQSFCCCFSQIFAVIGGEIMKCARGLGEVGGEILVVSDGSIWVSGGGVVRG